MAGATNRAGPASSYPPDLGGHNRNKGPLGLSGAVAILRSAAWKRDPGGKDCGVPTGSRRELSALAAGFASQGRRVRLCVGERCGWERIIGAAVMNSAYASAASGGSP